MEKLLEIQNKTDFLLKTLEKNQDQKIFDSNIYLFNLEEKIDFLYKNYENEKKGVGEDKVIVKNLKSLV